MDFNNTKIMTPKELHQMVYSSTETLAEKYGFKQTEHSFKQNFLLGETIPNPDNLVQDVKWEDGENRIEFRHRFSNVCSSIKLDGVFAEVEYNIDEKTQRPILVETHTFGGRGGLLLLGKIIEQVGI